MARAFVQKRIARQGQFGQRIAGGEEAREMLQHGTPDDPYGFFPKGEKAHDIPDYLEKTAIAKKAVESLEAIQFLSDDIAKSLSGLLKQTDLPIVIHKLPSLSSFTSPYSFQFFLR